MKRIISVLAVCAFIMLTACSCSIKKTENGGSVNTAAPTASTTAAQTKMHNDYKDRLPAFKFENEPSEKYDDGMRYILTVKCSQKEYEKYIKEVKKTGFAQNAIEDEGYFCAYDEQGYYAEITYIGEMMTVFVKLP